MTDKETKPINYDNIPASTKTFIVRTNITININELFEYLPITPYIVIPKRRGRKKKNSPANPNKNISDGSIITLEYQDKIRGVDLKNKRKKKKCVDTSNLSQNQLTYFRNATTVVMVINNKIINFKISRNGKFQMTGCKFVKQAESCIHYIWTYIKNTDLYKFTDEKDTELCSMFVPSMRNIDFDIGFNIDRHVLDHYINTFTEYHSLLETSIGYTGVNIKFPYTQPITDVKVKEITWKDGKWCNECYVPYSKYLKTEKQKDQKKKLDKKRYTTFLVFHSGKTIMSTISKDFGRDPFYKFLNIVKQNRDIFEEKIEPLSDNDEEIQ